MYKYQDNNDLLLEKLIQPVDSWDKGEDNILELFYSMIKYNNSVLDAGCGEGRLINKYESYFSEITVVERDAKRLEEATHLVNYLNLNSKVNFQLGKIQDLGEDKKFDSIICSHVLQHVSTDACEHILGKFANILSPKGLLLIFIPHSLTAKDVFTKVEKWKNEVTETEIEIDEFNDLTDKSNALPVRKFTMHSIYTLVEKHGFKRIKSGLYRILTNNADFDSTKKILLMDFFLIAEKL